MGKPRRPKGPRATWDPKPDLDSESPTLRAVPPTDTAIPAAAVSEAMEMSAESSEDDAGPDAPAEAKLPVAALVPPVTNLPVPVPPATPVVIEAIAKGGPVTFASDSTGIGATIASYMRGEGEAAVAHFRALTQVRTPADLIRLQVGEVQRAADASLTCWSTVFRKASRMVPFR
ncbi:hypothetical protein [Methylobacterium pseudosasicola]|uniref:Phasin protein n=1 Tax=Methylobacterium pseudosasicola TaxID=582667 RepID=A0A1I4JZQ5_9HYPH|nr:hypothetical protein [Methylobacterium pseudosasicola]SFL72005.1 hypothetical protein SAMN05192568_100969 [Methylobacterium pseudosasicola]